MSELQALFDNVETDLREAGDPEKVDQMVAYMKGHFDFLGVTSPVRRQLEKPLLKGSKAAEPEEVLDIAEQCWALDEREFQYVGCILLRTRAKSLRPEHLPRVEQLVRTKSWWDTIDSLAAHTVGPMVASYPELSDDMDLWIDESDMWVARVAILHQLMYKDQVNQDRLFSYVEKRASDTEFFIRKALGWALRNYARVAPDEVRRFVTSHQGELSGLTKREALKHL